MHVAQKHALQGLTRDAQRFCDNDMHKNNNLKRVA
ncbi:hypothetical protein SAMN05428953_12036 [Mesorhizobium muleiense]|uniref:Uncharacterized protein n=1 Tax=Mesorhizobium muleiense TaxID=1004279 RepID=A0A1G9EIV2_9HYPH|nr:hypothetical protein SAMN05428953_12036 [Mesorhizobium muleiense]